MKRLQVYYPSPTRIQFESYQLVHLIRQLNVLRTHDQAHEQLHKNSNTFKCLFTKKTPVFIMHVSQLVRGTHLQHLLKPKQRCNGSFLLNGILTYARFMHII